MVPRTFACRMKRGSRDRMKNARIRQTIFIMLLFCEVIFAKVTVDWDRQASFSDYKTYAWQKGTPAKNPLMDQRIVDAIDKQLSLKGLRKVEADKDPDLVVLYHASVGTETELDTTNMGGWGWRWGGGMSTTTVEKIPVGQLVVDIGDAKTKS
jgi:apolipoprotein N-acyltransferase